MQQANSPKPFIVDGVEYKFTPKREYFDFIRREVLKSRRNPILLANDAVAAAAEEGKPLDEATRKELIAVALREGCRNSVSQEDVVAFLNSLEGIAATIYMLVRENRPTFTMRDAWAVVDANFMAQPAAPATESAPTPPAPSSESDAAATAG